MRERIDYLRNAARIYERSFAVIRAEADLSRFSSEEAEIAVRMVHACGCVDIARRIVVGHRGAMAVRSRPGNTVFSVSIPAAGKAA